MLGFEKYMYSSKFAAFFLLSSFLITSPVLAENTSSNPLVEYGTNSAVATSAPPTTFTGQIDFSLDEYHLKSGRTTYAHANTREVPVTSNPVRIVITVDNHVELPTCSGPAGAACDVPVPALAEGCHTIHARVFDRYGNWLQSPELQLTVGDERIRQSCGSYLTVNRTQINSDESVRIEAQVTSQEIPVDRLWIDIYEENDGSYHYIKRCQQRRSCTLMLGMSAADGRVHYSRFYALVSDGEVHFLPSAYSPRIELLPDAATLSGNVHLAQKTWKSGDQHWAHLTGTVKKLSESKKNVELVLYQTSTDKILKRCKNTTSCSLTLRLGSRSLLDGDYYLIVRDMARRELLPVYNRARP